MGLNFTNSFDELLELLINTTSFILFNLVFRVLLSIFYAGTENVIKNVLSHHIF